MPLKPENLDNTVKLLLALSQRQSVIQDLAGRLSSGVVWRSPDGSLQVQLAEAERQQLEDFVRLYVEEAETILITLKAYLRDAAPEPRSP
jgi:hypothetical protein